MSLLPRCYRIVRTDSLDLDRFFCSMHGAIDIVVEKREGRLRIQRKEVKVNHLLFMDDLIWQEQRTDELVD